MVRERTLGEVTGPEFPIDSTVAHMARVYDYLVGGTSWFPVDQASAHEVSAALPGGIDQARSNVRLNRRFLSGAVRRLAGAGIGQFLDVGTGIPSNDGHSVHDVAPASRVVYVDCDPTVLAHAHRLLEGTQPEKTKFVYGDIRDTGKVLDEAAELLDLTQPVAVLMAGVLHYLADNDAHAVVAGVRDAICPGSCVVVSHLASDIDPEVMADMQDRHNKPGRAEEAYFRNRTEVSRFFDDLELLKPGVARLDEWLDLDEPPRWVPAIYCAIGRKP